MIELLIENLTLRIEKRILLFRIKIVEKLINVRIEKES